MLDNDNRPSISDLITVRTGQELLDLGLQIGDEVWFTYVHDGSLQRGWVAGHNAAHPKDRAVTHQYADEPDRFHGHFVNAVLAVNTEPRKSQSKKKDKLVLDALEAAEKRGYCAETRNVIRDMGLRIPQIKATRTVTLEFTGNGVDVENLSLDDLKINVSSGRTFVTVKVVETPVEDNAPASE